MNIFYLNNSQYFTASMLSNTHVVKMTLETAQILSTVHHAKGNPDGHKVLYKQTHNNHPSVLWAGQSKENYDWLYVMFKALAYEFQLRFNKAHKSFVVLCDSLKQAPSNLESLGFTEPPQVMPEQYKSEKTTDAYLEYYRHEKLNKPEDKVRFELKYDFLLSKGQ